MEGGVSIAEMLYRTNIFALLGGGDNPFSDQNQIVVWDDL